MVSRLVGVRWCAGSHDSGWLDASYGLLANARDHVGFRLVGWVL